MLENDILMDLLAFIFLPDNRCYQFFIIENAEKTGEVFDNPYSKGTS